LSISSKIKTFAKFDFGLVFFALYTILSILYFQERTLFLDNPFQVFHMIVEDKIEIMAGRWPASIIRYLPFMAIKAGLSLVIVLHVFSFSYLLFHFLVFAILRWWMREKNMSNYYALWLLLISGHAFFWNNSELIQACSVLFIFMAVVKKEGNGLVRSFGLLLFAAILLFYHPLVIIPIVAILILWSLQNPRRAKEYLLLLFKVILLFFLKSRLFPNWYDGGKQGAFNSNLKEIGLDIFRTEGFGNNMQSFLSSWNLIITLFGLFAMYFFFKEKKWLCFFGLPIGVLGYILLISFADPNQTFAFYNEVNFISLLAIILLGCMQLSYRVISNQMVCAVLLLFFVFRITWIGDFYSARIQYWESEITKAGEKQILKESDMDMSKLVMSWASPYESLLISKMQSESEQKTILVHPDPSKFKDRSKPDTFLTHFKPYSMGEVNKRYFDLSDDLGY